MPKGKKRELVAEGSYPAIAKVVADLGTQQPKNEKFEAKRALMILWEIPELGEKGSPVYIQQRLPLSSTSKNLKKFLKTWKGIDANDVADFDPADILNGTAEIDVVHSEDGEYANVDYVRPYKGKALKGFMDSVSCFLEKGEFDQESFEALPEWIQNLAIESEEFMAVSKEKKAVSKSAPKRGKK